MSNVKQFPIGQASVLRHFPAEQEKIAQKWAVSAFSDEEWVDIGPFRQSESHPREVVSKTGIKGIAKPADKRTDNIPRAAHEKIISDIGFQLGLPIPPVILWQREELNGAEKAKYKFNNGAVIQNPETCLAVSAWAFPQVMTWEEAVKVLSPAEQDTVLPVMSAIRIFDTWICAEDRHPNKHVLVNAELNSADGQENRIAVCFIDYAYSLLYKWKDDKNIDFIANKFFNNEVRASMSDMATKINMLDEDIIVGIVSRIPNGFLTDDQRSMIIEQLIGRRKSLAQKFNL